jgi:Cellulase (glycosyl hydrolase family 5)
MRRHAVPIAATAIALGLSGCGGGAKHEPLPPPAARPTIVQDDALLLHRSDAETRATLRELRRIGVDWVRVTAGWSVIAPDPQSPRAPAFDARDPDAYPDGAWGPLDRLVTMARDEGLRVLMDIAFWAPRWATGAPSTPAERQRTDIDPARYADFAEAVARRYGDRVEAFSVWNEPNHPAFLLPQWRAAPGGGFEVASADVYRAMLRAAYPRIKAAAPERTVLIGNTAATGAADPRSAGDRVPPLRFLRELACVDAQLRPLTTPACRDFTALPGDGWGHHPYSIDQPPWAQDPEPDNVRMGDLGRLADLLDRLAAAGRTATRLGVWVTEYGYQTDPPDPTQRVTTAEQARWLPEADRIALSDPRVRSTAQFLLRDLPPRAGATAIERWGDFQTGLRFPDGSAKPALRSFPYGLVALREGPARVRFWIDVRPGSGPRRVRIETRGGGGTEWSPLASFGERPTDDEGLLEAVVAADPAATYRVAVRDGGRWVTGEPLAGAR